MKKIYLYLTANSFRKYCFLVILLAFILRFWGYGDRWGLAYDQARDVLVARHALHTFSVPLIGPFASAGQFVYGPQWFWILMVMISFYQYSVLTPWIIITILHILMVYLMILIGKELQSKNFGLLVGLLAAVSTELVAQSTNLTSPSMVGIVSAATLYFFILYIKYRKNRDLFLVSFLVGNAINIHFQAIGLLGIMALTLFYSKGNFKKIAIQAIGFLIPFIPLIIFDLTNNFFESRNFLDYYLYGQYKIYIPNRWLTYVGTYWPGVWAKFVGGELVLGYVVIGLLAMSSIYAILKKKISKEIIMIGFALLIPFFMLRYYRGERISSNMVFLHPFIIVLSAWTILQLYKLNKYIAIFISIILILGSLKMDFLEIKNTSNFTGWQVAGWKKMVAERFPDDKFAVYDLQFGNKAKSLPFVMFLDVDNKISDDGRRIGLFIATSGANFKYPSIIGTRGAYQILDLSGVSDSRLNLEQWALSNQSVIYHSTEEWYK